MRRVLSQRIVTGLLTGGFRVPGLEDRCRTTSDIALDVYEGKGDTKDVFLIVGRGLLIWWGRDDGTR